MIERLNLSSIESEEMVLAHAMRDDDFAYDISVRLTAGCFVRIFHIQVFEAILACIKSNLNPTASVVKSKLDDMGRLNDDNVSELIQLSSARVPKNIDDHVQILKDKWILRELELAANQSIEIVHRTDIEDSNLKVEMAISRITEVGSEKRSDESETMQNLSKLIMQDIDSMMESGNTRLPGIQTPFPALNQFIKGWQKGCLYVIGARSSMGKTSLALQFAMDVARSKKVVHFESCEMTSKELTRRAIGNVGRLKRSMLTGELLPTETEYAAIADAIEVTYNLPITFHTPSQSKLTPSSLRANLKRTRRMNDGNLDLVLIDYVQLMGGDGRYSQKTYEIADITSQLKKIAIEFNVPIIVLSQLRRPDSTEKVRRPSLSDLSDSKSVENDADVVMLLHRQEYYDAREDKARPERNRSEAEIIVAKNRNDGSVGTVTVVFEPEYTRFSRTT